MSRLPGSNLWPASWVSSVSVAPGAQVSTHAASSSSTSAPSTPVLHGRTLGIVGLGRVGRPHLAPALDAALRATVLVSDPYRLRRVAVPGMSSVVMVMIGWPTNFSPASRPAAVMMFLSVSRVCCYFHIGEVSVDTIRV